MKQFAASLALLISLAAFSAEVPDAKFYRDAAEGGMAEVAMGNLAQQKAQSPSVKDYGAQMVKDHSAANEKLKALAQSKNITLPANPSVAEMEAKAKLEALSGQSFDKTYIKGMIQIMKRISPNSRRKRHPATTPTREHSPVPAYRHWKLT
jgi:predicted outer membrane protein